MSLVKRNDLNFVVKSLTVQLAGQVIVHITAEPLTTKLVAFTVLRHMSTRRILLRLHLDLFILVSSEESNIAVANGASLCANISFILTPLGLYWSP